MVPSAAGFKLTSDRGFKYYNQTSSNSKFEIDTTGNLNLKNNDINNAGAITTEELNGDIFVGAGDNLYAALDDVQTDETIIVYDGVHESAGERFWVDTDGVTLTILSPATIKMADDDADNISRAKLMSVGADDVTITGTGTLNGNQANQPDSEEISLINGGPSTPGANVEISGLTMKNYNNAATEIWDASVTYENLRVGGGDGVAQKGLQIQTKTAGATSKSVRIQNNTLGPFDGASGNDVIKVFGDEGRFEHVDISRNHCIGPWGTITQEQSGAWWFILVEGGARSVTIRGNTARATPDDGSGSGIYARSEKGYTEDVAITGNVLHGDGFGAGDGIHVNAPETAVVGNTVQNFNRAFRSYVKDFSLAGNIFGAEMEDLFSDEGIGFSPTDVSGSRSFDTTYANDTGLTRHVAITLDNSNGAIDCAVDVDGERVDYYRSGSTPDPHTICLTFEVPAGSEYKVYDYVDHGETVPQWNEWFSR